MRKVMRDDIERVGKTLTSAGNVSERDRFECYALLAETGAQLDELRARVREEITAEMSRVGLGGPGEAPIERFGRVA